MSALSRLAELFVAPPAAGSGLDLRVPATGARPELARRATRTIAADASVTVLGGSEAAAAGVMAARALARAAHRPSAVCAIWGAPVPSALLRGPALRGAAAVARRLADRGHLSAASGRVVVVRLAESEQAARAEAARLRSALADVPLVTVFAAALAEPLEPEPGRCDLVLVTAQPGSAPRLAELAAERLRAAYAALPVTTLELAARGPSVARARNVGRAVVEWLA